MTDLGIEHFEDYFRALNDGSSPYPWQRDLAERCVAGAWPGAIDLPTGSGKTACLDIAVFALACQSSLTPGERTVPRRIFFCVNRRVIVDEAFRRAWSFAQKLALAESGDDTVLSAVAKRLRRIAGTEDRPDIPPLDVLELRGGIYRDNRWARSGTQPTIVCTTVDQLGSRLLFRGYGVSTNAAPIHAALIAYDSLILLDEAHISEPFRQTLEAVSRYLDPARWAKSPISLKRFVFLPMTATPNDEMRARGVIGLSDQDRNEEGLNNRLRAPKPAELRAVSDIAKVAVDHALELAANGSKAIGIIVNRVVTAREINRQLSELRGGKTRRKRSLPEDAIVELVIGSMRPIDRDKQSARLAPLVGPERPKPTSQKTSIVIATQCLEVGADYDFDHLITECASIDALRQRFGRLNRSGRKGFDDCFIDTQSYILIRDKDAKPDLKLEDDKPADPIYGNAMARTWNWLVSHARAREIGHENPLIIDFGIDAFNELLQEQCGDGIPPTELLAPSASETAPVMLPAYIDMWCQTSPRPTPDPDVSLFLHGPRGAEPEVQVCWRADLVANNIEGRRRWPDVVALFPPTSAECMRMPISRLRRWLDDPLVRSDDSGDMASMERWGDTDSGRQQSTRLRAGVLWRGIRDSKVLESSREIRRGDTVVLPADSPRADLLGHLPELVHPTFDTSYLDEDDISAPRITDHAELAALQARDRACIRLHSCLASRLGPAFAELLQALEIPEEEPLTQARLRELIATAALALPGNHPLKVVVDVLSRAKLSFEYYPDGRGIVVEATSRLGRNRAWFPAFADEGTDEASLNNQVSVMLSDHSRHVAETTNVSLKYLAVDDSASEAFIRAAELHDHGKADERFQALLRRTVRTDAWLLHGAGSEPLAKSDGLPQTLTQHRENSVRAQLPSGFRHEMLSLQLAEQAAPLPLGALSRDLTLHLIAAHHGYARPFAPVAIDDELVSVKVENIELSHEQRSALPPPHRLDSGIADRFWRLTREYGWWGLAYLETVLRLADWQASADEMAGRYQGEKVATREGLGS